MDNLRYFTFDVSFYGSAFSYVKKECELWEQMQILNGSHSTTIHTETLNPYDEAEEDYYQSLLSLDDLSYFPVRETVYQLYPKAHSNLITDVKQGTVSSATEITFL